MLENIIHDHLPPALEQQLERQLRLPKRLSILLVDDDPDDFLITQALLSDIEDTYIDLEWLDSFDKAVDIIPSCQHDVFLFDYHLSGRTGVELLEYAIQQGVKQPIIMLTGYEDRAVDQHAIQMGAADYLIKGQVSADGLERAIRHALERSRILRVLREREAEAQKLAMVASRTDNAVIITDAKGHIEWVNEGFTRITEYSLEEVMGQTSGRFFAR